MGLVSFVEAVGDFVLLVLGGVASIGTAIYDIIHGIATGDWSWSATNGLWDDVVMVAVAYDWTTALDQAIGVRQALDVYAYDWGKSDGTACQIAKGVGYIAGIIVLTYFTFGAGTAVLAVGGGSGVVVGASAASVSGAVVTVTSSSLAAGAIAAGAGIGKNTAAAWNDGADTLSGLGYGIAQGSWEGLEMVIGYSINGLQIFQGSGFASQVGNSMSHVILDSIDGATGAVVSPLLQIIYSPNEENMANILQYIDGGKTWDELNIFEKYSVMFQSNGGWKDCGA